MEKKTNHRKNKRNILNSLFFRLALTVVIGSIILMLSLFVTNLQSFQKVFMAIFSDSQTKIFSQIEEVFYELYTDMAEIASEVEEAEAVREFLLSDSVNSVNEMSLIYNIQTQVDRMKISEYDDITLLIVGKSGKSYIYGNSECLNISTEEIMELPITKEADETKGNMVFTYMESGFTDVTKDEPVVIGCRTIQDKKIQQIVGYSYFIIKEENLRKKYDYFVSEAGDMYILNQNRDVISTNNKNHIDKRNVDFEALKGNYEESGQSYLYKQFDNNTLVIVGVLNPYQAFLNNYDMLLNVAITFLITLVIVSVVFFLVRRLTRPLYKLVDAMKSRKEGVVDSYVESKGTQEIVELSQTYNELLQYLNLYINKVQETEKEKRVAELHALQMQINPHYIYNTLASIKWMILQKKDLEAAETLDAFIALLRNTISNVDEFISVEQEIENVKNYVLINHKRYGGRIQVEFFVTPDCTDCYVPKLILQPFIENAFFHGFPGERRGRIEVFASIMNEILTIEISDNGVGIETEKVNTLLKGAVKKEHFTGIGIKNVDERVKMIYGKEYGVHVESEKNCGTIVRIKIPTWRKTN